MIYVIFSPSVEEAIKIEALKVMRNICIKSEANREALATEWKILPSFVDLIKVDEPSTEFIRQVSLEILRNFRGVVENPMKFACPCSGVVP